MEEWKYIENYSDYMISTLGNIISLKYNNKKPCKPSLDNKGYKKITLSQNGIQKKFRVSRLVANTFIPNTENKPQIDHINRIRSDDSVTNLRWVDNKENNQNKSYPRGKSGFRNIHFKDGKYKFCRRTEGIYETYDTLLEALEARDKFYKKNNLPLIE